MTWRPPPLPARRRVIDVDVVGTILRLDPHPERSLLALLEQENRIAAPCPCTPEPQTAAEMLNRKGVRKDRCKWCQGMGRVFVESTVEVLPNGMYSRKNFRVRGCWYQLDAIRVRTQDEQ